MTTKIQKWGNSLAVRLPKQLATRLNLKEGSEVVVNEREQSVIIKRMVLRQQPMEENVWKQFVIPTTKRKENVSEKIDEVLYGKSR
jgi:antitoxin MazE